MTDLDDLQQRTLDVHNCGESIECAIWGAVKPEAPYKSPHPFGMCTADSCCKTPIPFMYCAFTYLIGKGSEAAEANLKKFDCLYNEHFSCTLNDLFDEGEQFIEKPISDSRSLCR